MAGLLAVGAASALGPAQADAEEEGVRSTALKMSTRGSDVNGVVAIEEDGTDGIRSFSGLTGWSDTPQMRLRVSRASSGRSGAQHLLLTPYEFGMALEYNGVMECWVNEFSIHNNSQGGDNSGAMLWVGDHTDTGGLYMSASSRPTRYTEIVSQLFDRRTSAGPMRFVVRGPTDSFDFRSGTPGNEGTRLKITADGELFARYEDPAKVWVGAAGPANEAGIAFGAAADTRLYRSEPATVRTNGRLVADRGLGVGNAVPANSRGLRAKFEIFDSDGRSMGFVPVYDRIR